MKVIGNVQLDQDAISRLANRLKFPAEGTPTHVTAYGEEYAVGQSVQAHIDLSDDMVISLNIEAIRTKDGDPGLKITVHPLYKDGYCVFCGAPNPGWECPTCGAS